MRILLRVSDSVLWLYSEREAQDNLRAAAAACGVAGERLVFAKRLPRIAISNGTGWPISFSIPAFTVRTTIATLCGLGCRY